MFNSPFSFEGRIRRLEYGLSLIIYIVLYMIVLLISQSVGQAAPFIILFAMIPIVWFIWAQGAKRCHDIGRSGWMQIIPFYVLFLLFENGEPRTNEYGANPKYPEQDLLGSETLDEYLKN